MTALGFPRGFFAGGLWGEGKRAVGEKRPSGLCSKRKFPPVKTHRTRARVFAGGNQSSPDRIVDGGTELAVLEVKRREIKLPISILKEAQKYGGKV